MFFESIIRRRLLLLLQSWLREPPDIELKIGLIRSHLILKNLKFDPIPLNKLLDESSNYCFKELNIELLSLHFSNWSFPAFNIQVNGVYAVMSLGGLVDGAVRNEKKFRNKALEDLGKNLSMLDPEGFTLHEALGKLCSLTPAKSRIKRNFINTISNHSQLGIGDVRLQLQFPTFNEDIACLSRLKELTVVSQYHKGGCIIGRIVGSIFIPSEETSFVIKGSGFEAGIKKDDYTSCLLHCRDLSVYCNVNDLHLDHLTLHTPELRLTFTPLDFVILSVLDKVISRKEKHYRNGRQLWKLAASRIGHVTSARRFSVQRLIGEVILWLRYISVYQDLLSLVGYPAGYMLRRSASRMSRDTAFMHKVKRKWKLISDIERDLPSDATAQARRIVRFRVKKKYLESGLRESFPVHRHVFLHSILTGFVNICRLVCSVFQLLRPLLILRSCLQEPVVDGCIEMSSEKTCLGKNFGFSIEKVVVNLLQKKEVCSGVVNHSKQHFGLSYSDFLSFSLMSDNLSLQYVDDIFYHSFFFYCGRFSVSSTSTLAGGGNISSHTSQTAKLQQNISRISERTIIWSEPTDMSCFSGTISANDADKSLEWGSLYLKKFLEEMWLSWQKNCWKIEEIGMECSEYPFLLCGFNSFLMHPDSTTFDDGFFKLNLVVGKLNFTFDYSSIVSAVLFLRQIQHTLCWRGDVKERALLDNLGVSSDEANISWVSKYDVLYSMMNVRLLKILPEKHIQMGVFIAGPQIRMSFSKENPDFGNDDANISYSHDHFHVLTFDIHDTEVAILPTSKFNIPSQTRSQEHDETKSVCDNVEAAYQHNVLKGHAEGYMSQMIVSLGLFIKASGLNAYLEGPMQKKRIQILSINPITFQLMSTRKCLHSFSTTEIALSGDFHGMAAGLRAACYMDEYTVFLQVFADSISAISHVSSIAAVGCFRCQEFRRHDIFYSGSDGEEGILRGLSLVDKNTKSLIKGTFKLCSIDVLFQPSTSCKPSESSAGSFDASKLCDYYMLDFGSWISVKETCFDVSCGDRKMEIIVDLSGIEFSILRCASQVDNIVGHPLMNISLQSLDCLYEAYFSNCVCSFWWCSPRDAASNELVGHEVDVSLTHSDFSMTNVTETSVMQSCSLSEKLAVPSNIQVPSSNHCLLMKIAVTQMFMGKSTVKHVLIKAHEMSKLVVLISIARDFKSISGQMQGGLLLCETTAFAMFSGLYASYMSWIDDLVNMVNNGQSKQGPGTVYHDDNVQEMSQVHLSRLEMLETFGLEMSEFSVVLAAEEQTGCVRELTMDVNIKLKLEMKNMRRKILMDHFCVSIFSQIIPGNANHDANVPHLSSVKSNKMGSSFASGDPVISPQHWDGKNSSNDASLSEIPPSIRYSVASTSSSRVIDPNHRRFILKQFFASAHVEIHCRDPIDMNCAWIGHGLVSGLNVMISLSEMQIILLALGSFSKVSGKDKSSTIGLGPGHWANNHKVETTFEKFVPNGAIVAIQDVNQHMYLAVEDQRDALVGAVHYSLVGERALFRVSYQSQSSWRSSVMWFSLISLNEKDESGVPLRLSCRRNSSFVGVSSSNDKSTLWRVVLCEPKTSDGDIDWESHNQLAKGTFYLINKKNDCAVSFVNGTPEFVKKPGSPFKFKIFQDSMLDHYVTMVDSYSLESMEGDMQECIDKKEMIRQKKCLPFIDIEVKEISVTVVHELLDAEDIIPLLQGCMADTQITMQVLPAKVRIICSVTTLLDYFDAQRNTWRQLIKPVETCIYFRSRSQRNSLDFVKHGVPIHFYCRTKEWDIFLTELSLDVLLFVLGKLNVAGPYSVRSSMILPNCCKVENQSAANVLCQFPGNQNLKVAGKQSGSACLRHLVLANQSPATAPVVSIKLMFPGSYTTSSIHLSLLETKALAWRTRIGSLHDSKTYPGPFVVVEVVRKSDEGLSIVVSPLMRIHNETDFSMEMRFQRPQLETDELVSVVIKKGETVDDSTATYDAMSVSGGLKKALVSLSVGNFLFSFRPKFSDGTLSARSSMSVGWSDDIQGGKARRISGAFDKLKYRVRKVFGSDSKEISFSTACCSINFDETHTGKMHFLIQNSKRDVPIGLTDNLSHEDNGKLPTAVQEQKEIFLLPTVRVFNLLQTAVQVLLTDRDPVTVTKADNMGAEAILSCGSAANFYVNPEIIYFSVTLSGYDSTSKPLNSSDLMKKLLNRKTDINYVDFVLDFGCGKYFASLRLSRGQLGILEAAIFTQYSLKNETDLSLYIYPINQKPLLSDEARKTTASISPELGLYLPPKCSGSWFLKSTKVRIRLLQVNESEATLDLNVLSGFSELRLETCKGSEVTCVTKFGVSVGLALNKTGVPAQLVNIVPRYVVYNHSEKTVFMRQCNLEDDIAAVIAIESKHHATLQLQDVISKRSELNLFENLIRRHRNINDDSVKYIQFRQTDPEFSWSGPVCVASLGCFFLKFRIQSDLGKVTNGNTTEFANVHVVEEGSSLVMHFYRPPNAQIPYRIENCLHDALLTYYQKDSSESEVLQPESCTDYIWDDLTLPHKLVIQINDIHLLREINLDKVREWKPFSKAQTYEGFSSRLASKKKSHDAGNKSDRYKDMVKLGYEVYADGSKRVLRICEMNNRFRVNRAFYPCQKIRIRVPSFTIHMLGLEDAEINEFPIYTPVVNSRIGCVNLDALITDKQKYSQITVQSLNVEPKWAGAPFAAMLRRHPLDFDDSNECLLRLVIVLQSTSSTVKQVQYLSVILQPIDLNLDEETLVRIVPFWRSSLSKSDSPSQQYYFDHFEIHPIKIIANFLPGDSYSSYSSTQETLRSFIHSVVKVPPIKNMVVELNGVFITHALITVRELSMRCAQHYSWYAMRAIYIAKGSPFLPPSFVSIFDDLASSSLDVFFDPSHALMKLPGITLGTFKLISKSIRGRGFSGTKRYFGDLGKTLRTAGSNVLFAAVTELSDSVLKGAETNGFDGMINGFHQGILKLAMEPSVLGSALMGGGPDRTIMLDQSPGIDELYIEGYLQAMLDAIYKQEYLRVRVIDNQVLLKNLPPNSSLTEEIIDRVKGFLVSKALLKGDPSTSSRPLRNLRGENEWKVGPTVMTLAEHLFVSFTIRMLKNQASKVIDNIRKDSKNDDDKAGDVANSTNKQQKARLIWRWGIGQFVLSGILAYVDGRLCRHIPNPVIRRIVSGFLLSFLDRNDKEKNIRK